MSRATFRPRVIDVIDDPKSDAWIEVLIVDDSGSGVEIRIFGNGNLESHPLTNTADAYRASPLWEEVLDEA